MTKNVVNGAGKRIAIGRIAAVYGVKGWVKVISYTQPVDNLLDYRHWILDHNGVKTTVEIDQGRTHGKGLIAHIAGCDDRELARRYCDSTITISENELPPVADDEVYWHQLEGLDVMTLTADGKSILLGKVNYLMETGANDVLVIKPSKGSIDRRERLVPWLWDQVVTDVNPEKGFIRVNWDPEF
ncbi:Ribosome maturation factor RimM [invertebrate metagenome]|uniref:Ribosome maturation factor RimM n=1 Tax=invertebrate metagenome TaxID=1711999 RepID=A0A2H9T8N2_9ZZZZ